MTKGVEDWETLGAPQLRDVDPETVVALLPVAAVEQHGPHLPLGTDAMILDGVLERVAALAQGAAHVLRLPTQRAGNSLEHTDFAGTLHIPPRALMDQWLALSRSARRAGLRKLAIVNSHGGQGQLVDLVAQELRASEEMLVARVQTFRLGMPDGLFSQDELRHGLHGGEVETSMMLALRPELVRMEAARDFANRGATMEAEHRILHPEGDAGLAWQAQDLNDAGATGNAAAADAERGRQALDHVARRVMDVLLDLAEMPLAPLRGDSA